MLEFYVKAKRENRQVKKFTDEWRERLAAFITALPQEISEKILEDVVALAPTDIPKYPDMLKVVQIPRQGEWEVAGVIPPGWNYSQRLKASDVQRTIIDIFPKMRGGEVVSEAAVVLSRNNPWTMQTLPYEPERKEASIRARRVDEKIVKEIERQREAKRREVNNELRSLGVPLREAGRVLLSRRVSRDIVFEVLRREKGIGMPGKAHWRPAIRAVYTQHFNDIMKELGKWMSDPENEDWRRSRTLPVEAASIIKRVGEFQDRVAPG